MALRSIARPEAQGTYTFQPSLTLSLSRLSYYPSLWSPCSSYTQSDFVQNWDHQGIPGVRQPMIRGPKADTISGYHEQWVLPVGLGRGI